MELTTLRAVELFLASLHTRSAPPNTIKAYRLDLQQFLKQAPTDISEVTADMGYDNDSFIFGPFLPHDLPFFTCNKVQSSGSPRALDQMG